MVRLVMQVVKQRDLVFGGKLPRDRHAEGAGRPGTLDAVPDEATDDAPYFVTVSRSGFRRLHVSRACAVRQERCLEWMPLQLVTADCADAVCKLCRPKLDARPEESSDSASDSEALRPAARAA